MRAAASAGRRTFDIPARRATRRMIRPAPCRSSRCQPVARNTRPSHRSPTVRSMARAVRGAADEDVVAMGTSGEQAEAGGWGAARPQQMTRHW
jgi:hypothetical protein